MKCMCVCEGVYVRKGVYVRVCEGAFVRKCE